ncbi:hypothetical protein [Bacillus aquiflavi]|uniref:hypothetical protein n=1 Tax=Bacillus aquiflavi TaxID=2672567 RepID=UPI0029311221|nr:hypothetical protein [Bacillus aquiflavi]
MMQKQLNKIESGEKYESIQLPIADSTLKKLCQERCTSKGCKWGAASDLTNDFLIHRHTLRDRSNVIQERRKQLLKRKGNE